MDKKIALLLVAALGVPVALPVFAAPAIAVERPRDARPQWKPDTVLRQLQARGVNATSVEQWNGVIRAYVEVNGTQVMQYFDPTTLTPVNP
ncbi:hypothetical protein [Devosia sp. 2618]|uniref:hypothetical protein n=1 Tax=Devosia sp. 2618 TaxID=3156454 RepID=UPI003397B8B9